MKPMRFTPGRALMVSAACVLLALLIVAAMPPDTTAGPCTMIRETAMLRGVPEASGLALSRKHPDVIWTHNDSGNDSMLFAVDALGEARGRVRVPFRTRDWEDLSAGPCSPIDAAQGTAGDCLYIADIGDNDVARRSVQVLRVPEPEPEAARTARPEVFTLTYPDGPHNAEAMFVVDGVVFVVTKDRRGVLFRSAAPLREPGPVAMRRVRELGIAGVTDAEASRDGASIVIRTVDEAIVYRTADLLDGRSAPAIARVALGRLREPQGEGVALDGDVLYLASESAAWSRAGRLLSLRCAF